MSDESESSKPAENEVKPTEGKSSEASVDKKPAKKAKKKSGKKPKTESKGDDRPKESKESKETREPKESKEPKDSRNEDGRDSEGRGSSRRRRSRGSSSKSTKPISNHDPALLAQYAWKIYLAEISEEGVTMTDDPAAKVLARRCFDLASIFLDEQARNSRGSNPDQ